MRRHNAPVVVVGGGLAGLSAAIELAPAPVVLLSRCALGNEVASAWAQGGIAAAVGTGDSPALHAADTLAAGDGHCDPDIVALVTREAPAAIAWLERHGAAFDRSPDGRIALGREGGHGLRRIAHVRDATGAAVTGALVDLARRTPSITILEGVEALELLVEDGRVAGLLGQRGEERLLFSARAVVLATGGAGALYARTSNPLGARGDGLVMAAEAGAELVDLEFVQFHPTALDLGRDPMPLATEAIRGEGAILVNDGGERFMEGRHPMAELAPRDIVARAIFRERAAGRRTFLDARAAIGSRFAGRFPTVQAACGSAGIDPARDLIPIAPAAHYHMGGVVVDADARSTLPGLWAVGEVASTGLHGANRLASNSLLEATVFGLRAAHDIAGTALAALRPRVPPRTTFPASGPDDWRLLTRVRALMDARVGVERDADGLRTALDGLLGLRESSGPVAHRAATAGLLIAAAALERRESRGGHFRTDFPFKAEEHVARRRWMLRDALETARRCAAAEAVALAAVG